MVSPFNTQLASPSFEDWEQVVPAVRNPGNKSAQERREFTRFSTLEAVQVNLRFGSLERSTPSSRWFPADLIDISEGGLCLLIDARHLPEICATGNALQVGFPKNESSLTVHHGQLRWLQHHAEGFSSLGLAFTAMPRISSRNRLA